MNNMIKEIGQFFEFIANPFLVLNPDNKTSIVRSLYFTALTISVGLLLGLVGELPAIQKYFCYPKGSVFREIFKLGFLYAFLLVGLMVPIIEELIFRFYLNSVLGNIIYLFINLFIIGQKLYGFEQLQIIVIISFFVVSVFLISILFENNILFRKKMSLLVTKYFRVFLYISVLAFALAHLANLEICKRNSLLIILLVLPQCFSGLVYSYARMRWGLKTGILVHAFNNVAAITLMYLFR